MQTFKLDISIPAGPLVIYAKQADSMSRFFKVALSDSGASWEPPPGSVMTVRFGAPGMPAGWYDTITEPDGGTHSAFSVSENTVAVEIAEQAVSSPGKNVLCLLVNGADGYQLAGWNFELAVQAVPGLAAPEVETYYNALTEQVANALKNAQAAQASADAAAQSAKEAAASAGSVNAKNLLTKAEYGGSTGGTVKKADAATNADMAEDAKKVGGQLPSWYTPPGMIAPYGGAAAPAGWLLCDGREVLRASYPALFAAIGTTFGAGDGKASFHLPDLRGRVAAGVSTSNALATKAGADSKAIEKKHLPVGGVAITFASDKDNAVERNAYATPTWSKKYTINSNGIETGDGTNTPLDVRQPTMYLNYIIKT